MSLLRRWHEIAEKREEEIRETLRDNPHMLDREDIWFTLDTMDLNRKLQEIAVERFNRFVRNRRLQ